MLIGIITAEQRYGVSRQALSQAVKRGQLPALVVEVTQLRFRPKDVAAYVATIPEWRRINGRRGGLKSQANWRAMKKEDRPKQFRPRVP